MWGQQNILHSILDVVEIDRGSHTWCGWILSCHIELKYDEVCKNWCRNKFGNKGSMLMNKNMLYTFKVLS